MLRILCLLFLIGGIAGCNAATEKELQLWSQPVCDGFIRGAEKEKILPVTISLSEDIKALAQAKIIDVKVVSRGAGGPLYVNLALNENVKTATQADLIRTAMSAAIVYYQIINLYPDSFYTEIRAIQANIYNQYANDGEDNILLATATIASSTEKRTDFTFPSPAWTNVLAVERLPNDLEVRYLQLMQRNLVDWGFYEKQENTRASIMPEHDKQLSDQLNIQPGSINLSPFVLKPIH